MSSRHGLEIRAATAADAPGVAELLGGAGYPVAPLALAARLAAIRAASGTALLALEWGPPSGIIVLHWYPTLGDNRLSARITALLVSADDRRRGLARLLVKGAAQAARVAGCANLAAASGEGQVGLAEFLAATGFGRDGAGWSRNLRKQ